MSKKNYWEAEKEKKKRKERSNSKKFKARKEITCEKEMKE